MLVRVWEYEVAPGRAAEFEQLYGSAGAWAQLFARSAGHLSTELYRAVDQPETFSKSKTWRFPG